MTSENAEGAATARLAAQWGRIQARLRAEYGEGAYQNWLRALTLAGLQDDAVLLHAPTRFMADWISGQYGDRLSALWALESGAARALVTVRPFDSPASEIDPGIAASGFAGSAVDAMAADALSAPLNDRFTFADFVVGESNRLACGAARAVAEGEVQPGRNPLFLCGGVGLGKTHLMHAIARRARERSPDLRVVYLSAEKFMYQFVRALREKGMMAFKEAFRSVDMLLVDDIQFIVGKSSTQEEFFHTFNALMEDGRRLVMSADRPPAALDGLEDRMRSRLGGGLVAEIRPADYELRLAVLRCKLQRVNCAVPDSVLEFMAQRITANIRELEGALNRLAAHAELTREPVTPEMAQRVLHDLLRAGARRVNIDQIQKRVADHYNIRLSDMHSARRSRTVARPRQVAMYLSKQLTSRSLPEIGRLFGGRDHSTVMHAVRRVEDLSRIDADFARDVESLRRTLEL